MKFFSIIKTFDKKQWLRFVTYVRLYHKPDSSAVRLVDWFGSQKAWTGLEEKYEDTSFLLKHLPFKINAQTLSNNITILGNIAEEYLGWMVWKDSNNLKKSCQLLGLAQKSLSDQYIKTQKEVVEKKGETLITVWDEFYKMQSLFFNYYFGISPSNDNYIQEFTALVETFKNAVSSIAQILFVEMRNREVLLSESWPLPEYFFRRLYNRKTELFEITDHLIKMIKYKNTESYDALVILISSTQSEQLSHHIKYSIATYCIVFLHGEIKKGDLDKGQQLLDLYEFCLDNGFLTLSEKISTMKFLNIINVASKLGKYKWAGKIIDQWAMRVDKSDHKSLTKLGYAIVDFEKKKYVKVISALTQLKTTNYMHKFQSRWLLMQAQFIVNREYIEVLKVQVDNFRRFINSNHSKNSESTNEGFKSTIKILNMLLDQKPKEQILDFYKNQEFVFARTWIVQQIKNPVS